MDEEPSLLPHNNDETTPLVVQSEGEDLEENAEVQKTLF